MRLPAVAAAVLLLTSGCLVDPGGPTPPPAAVTLVLHAASYDPNGSEYPQRITVTISTIGVNGREGRYQDATGAMVPGPQILTGQFTPHGWQAEFSNDIQFVSATYTAVMPRGGRLECWITAAGTLHGRRQGVTVPTDLPEPAGPASVTCLYP